MKQDKPPGISPKEWEIIQQHYKSKYIKSSYKDKQEELEIQEVIMIVHNPKKLHDSGYPFIRVFGIVRNKSNTKHLYSTLVDMGWHDHYMIFPPNFVNIDSLGKNIFRLMSFNKIQWKVQLPCWTSSLSLDDKGIWR